MRALVYDSISLDDLPCEVTAQDWPDARAVWARIVRPARVEGLAED
jgi:hypothetical protein